MTERPTPVPETAQVGADETPKADASQVGPSDDLLSRLRHPLDAILRRPDASEIQGYCFIPNLEPIPREIQLEERLVLRRATAEEIGELRLITEWLVRTTGPRSHPWDHRCIKTPTDSKGCATIAYAPLDEQTHRYHVLAFRGGNNNLAWDAMHASVLATGPELLHGPELLWGGMRGLGSGSDLAPFLERAAFGDEPFERMSDGDADDLVSLFPLFAALPREHDLRRKINEYTSLRALGKHVRMQLLGRFAILESLIVHKPKGSDPYDSITRQVKTKMTLLERRLERPVEYTRFVVAGKIDATWGSLYSLRSTIAHGGRPTFDKGEFARLRSLENADRLVASAVRSVLRQTLHEPELLEDLRDC